MVNNSMCAWPMYNTYPAGSPPPPSSLVLYIHDDLYPGGHLDRLPQILPV